MPNSLRLMVFAADVGSIRKGNFAWASDPALSGRDHVSIAELASSMAEAVKSGQRIALGMECPLFVPCPVSLSELGRARQGEEALAWSAQVGAIVAMLGFQQLCWILRTVRDQLSGNPTGTLEWSEFSGGQHTLFLWEAFVSGKAKGVDHLEDALIAVRAFRESRSRRDWRTSVSCPHPASLAGAALIWSGWSHDTGLVQTPAEVIRGNERRRDGN
jgi:hypothetical protein